ncbi:MAG: hypothetical protein ACJAZ2_002219 [Glaciecola sp.]|jgi:hypothetical protein
MKILIFTLITALAVGTLTTKEKLQNGWNLTAIEEFGSKWDVDEKNKDDFMNLKADGSYEMTFYGEKKAGTWSFNKGGKTINFVNGDKKFFFKLKSISDTALIAEYQAPSLIKSDLHFTVIAK